jgi:hypothetical protein
LCRLRLLVQPTPGWSNRPALESIPAIGSDPTVTSLPFLLPLIVIGFTAGGLRTWANLHHHPPRRRRLLQLGWVALLLAGVPAWLVLAAVLRLW